MSHVRKMALVDPRLLETLRTPTQTPVDTTLRDLDAEMTSILVLDKSDVDVSEKVRLYNQAFIIIIIIRQPLCPVVGRRPQQAVSKLPCLVLSSAISCRSSICPGRLSIAWLVSLVVFSCHMVSNW